MAENNKTKVAFSPDVLTLTSQQVVSELTIHLFNYLMSRNMKSTSPELKYSKQQQVTLHPGVECPTKMVVVITEHPPPVGYVSSQEAAMANTIRGSVR